MEQVEQVFFNVPLSKLEPIFKRKMYGQCGITSIKLLKYDTE